MDAQSPESSPAAQVRGQRPVGVTVTSVYYAVVGVFAMVFGAGMLTLGQSFAQLDVVSPGIGSQAGGLFTTIAVVALVLGVLWVVSAVGLIMARSWGRSMGLGMGVIGAVIFGLASVGILLNLGSSSIANLAMNLVLAAIFVYAVWALAGAAGYFARR